MKAIGLIVSLLVPTLAFAAGGGHGEPSISDTIPYWIHFLVYLAIMTYLLKKPAISGWNSRRKNLEDLVLKGERELAAAQERLETARGKLASLDKEIEEIKDSILSDTKQEVEMILAEAKAQSERVLAQGKSSAEAEERSAEKEVQNELAAQVIERAREIIKSDVNQDSDKKYRDAAVSSVNSLLQ